MDNARRNVTPLLVTLLLAALSACGLPPQRVQDQLDQRALLNQFNLPAGYALVAYDGFPSMVGFGQREGLEISAEYELEPGQVQDFLKNAAGDGWQPLPIPQAVRSKILYQGMKVPLDLQNGLYTCRTAGDNVLHAKKTRPCSEVDYLHDIIIGVFDPAKAKLYLVIRSGY